MAPSRSCRATPEKERETEFLMLRDGLIVFEGDADALRRSTDPYIQTFLFCKDDLCLAHAHWRGRN